MNNCNKSGGGGFAVLGSRFAVDAERRVEDEDEDEDEDEVRGRRGIGGLRGRRILGRGCGWIRGRLGVRGWLRGLRPNARRRGTNGRRV